MAPINVHVTIRMNGGTIAYSREVHGDNPSLSSSQIAEIEMDAIEYAVSQRLIELGWTPPKARNP